MQKLYLNSYYFQDSAYIFEHVCRYFSRFQQFNVPGLFRFNYLSDDKKNIQVQEKPCLFQTNLFHVLSSMGRPKRWSEREKNVGGMKPMATERGLLFFDFSPSAFSLSFPDRGKAGTK